MSLLKATLSQVAETPFSPSPLRLIRQTRVEFFSIRLDEKEFCHSVCLSFLSDQTPEGELIFNQALNISKHLFVPLEANIIAVCPQTELGGINLKHQKIRKGPWGPIKTWIQSCGRSGFETKTIGWLDKLFGHTGSISIVADQQSDLGIVWVKY